MKRFCWLWLKPTWTRLKNFSKSVRRFISEKSTRLTFEVFISSLVQFRKIIIYKNFRLPIITTYSLTSE